MGRSVRCYWSRYVAPLVSPVFQVIEFQVEAVSVQGWCYLAMALPFITCFVQHMFDCAAGTLGYGIPGLFYLLCILRCWTCPALPEWVVLVLLLVVFAASVYVIIAPEGEPPDPVLPRPRRPRQSAARQRRKRERRPSSHSWRRARRFRRRHLPFCLIGRCRGRIGNRPSRWNAIQQEWERFPSPLDSKHRRWKRRRRRWQRPNRWTRRRRRVQRMSCLPLFVRGAIDEQFLDGFCQDKDFAATGRLLLKFQSLNALQKFVFKADHAANAEKIAGMIGSALEVTKVLKSGVHYETTPLIWDTGASFGLTPFRSDFIDYVEADIPVKDVTKVN